MFRRFYSHPLALLLALGTTLAVISLLARMAGTEGAYAVLGRVGVQAAQQVVVMGHRVVQQVVIVGRKLGN